MSIGGMFEKMAGKISAARTTGPVAPTGVSTAALPGNAVDAHAWGQNPEGARRHNRREIRRAFRSQPGIPPIPPIGDSFAE